MQFHYIYYYYYYYYYYFVIVIILTVCGRSPAEIVGSNPTGSMDVCLL